MRGIKKSARHQERAKKLEHTGRDRSHHRMPFFSGPPYGVPRALALQLSRSSQHLPFGQIVTEPLLSEEAKQATEVGAPT